MEGVHLEILAQPDDTSCGPTCLQAIYRYFGEELPLQQVIDETPQLNDGGTLAVLLGCHALSRDYRATIYSFNLNLFDPTWFPGSPPQLIAKLQEQLQHKSESRLQSAAQGYMRFLTAGGHVRMVDLTRQLLRKYLSRSIPILAGLSSTFLYRAPREIDVNCEADDVRGVPTGHFVVLCGYDPVERQVRVADPYLPNPLGPADHYYVVDVDRVVCAILLGVLTFDANLLILRPPHSSW